MITVILTYRNREITKVKSCMDSLQLQSSKAFEVVIVNYGSDRYFFESINNLVKQYEFANILNCNTQGELWCKSRAINIALKQIETPYVFVGDVDMLFHPNFVAKLEVFKYANIATYFQVGFLSQTETNQTKKFKDYNINFKSSPEATGMTFFNTIDLLNVNGYDEFYNGWGSEDTDIHIRLTNDGVKIDFYDEEVLLLHQWHPKKYRTKDSIEPFHSHLEQINHSYLNFTEQSKKTKANLKLGFGNYNDDDYQTLKNPDLCYKLTNKTSEIKGFVNNILLTETNAIVKLEVNPDIEYKSFKHFMKKLFGKKTFSFMSMEQVNNLLLEKIICSLRSHAYDYQFNKNNNKIVLTIKL